MDTKEILKKELGELYNVGVEIFNKKEQNMIKLSKKYQSWYSRALLVIKQLIPDRLEEFTGLYRIDKRDNKTFNPLTYTISDYLLGISITNGVGAPRFSIFETYKTKFNQQLSIFNSIFDRLDTILADILGVLQEELFDDEIEASKELLRKGHLRASGALVGVTLERHLTYVLSLHEIKIAKKNPAIADLNDALKDNDIIDIPNWRFIQRLGDIRNYCAHNKEREPAKDEVNDLIIGVEKVLKTVF